MWTYRFKIQTGVGKFFFPFPLLLFCHAKSLLASYPGSEKLARAGMAEWNGIFRIFRYSGILGHQMKFWKMSVPFASPPGISGIRSNGKRPRIPCARDVQRLVLSSYPFPTALYGDERGDGKYAFLLH